MSTPLNVPTKWKPIVGLIGSALTFVIPTVLEYSTSLPDPWPWVIAATVAGLTWLGIYKAPYVPEGAVLAPDTPAVAVAAQQAVTQAAVAQAQSSAPGEYKSPWPKP